jgi:hypothetical protein
MYTFVFRFLFWEIVLAVTLVRFHVTCGEQVSGFPPCILKLVPLLVFQVSYLAMVTCILIKFNCCPWDLGLKFWRTVFQPDVGALCGDVFPYSFSLLL